MNCRNDIPGFAYGKAGVPGGERFSEACFAEWRTELLRSMTAFCRDGELAEDAVQQAFLKSVVHRGLLGQMPRPAAKAWIYAAARNYIVDEIRKRKRLVLEEAEPIPVGQDFTDSVLVKSLVEELPENLKRVVHLRYYAGLNSTEIGAMLEITPSTVRYHLRSAISRLKEMVEGKTG